jgi:D-glycero-alpha-D-manno-heptose-7-phosphate kinase
MIITRTPLRISLGGGGTDLPSYYERFGGMVVSAAISKHIYLAVNETFTDDYFLKYSALERVQRVEDIDHPLVREALLTHPLGPSIELVSLADIPSGTGLGSSGSFTVGLLRTIYAQRREHVTAAKLAEEACAIEIERLRRPVGKQDQYIAAFGGLTCFDFHPDGRVDAHPLAIPTTALHDLEEHLLMFFTGYSRGADEVLEDQRRRSQSGDTGMLDNLRFIKEIGYEIKEALESGDCARFGKLLDIHWQHKRERTVSMSNPDINWWYDVAMDSGALGGKLVGAGAGGFLLFFAQDTAALRAAMTQEGLREVRFSFDHDGSTVIVRE